MKREIKVTWQGVISVIGLLCVLVGCNSSVKEVIDAIDGVPRKEIITARHGINAFVNDSRFGSINQQFLTVRDTLKLDYVRVLFSWGDGQQPTPDSKLNLDFYDQILNELPSGLDVVVLVTGAPSWMSNSANWTNGNPRQTFVEKFARPVFERYANRGQVTAWQIWNEPNNPSIADNDRLELTNSPVNFAELTSRSASAARSASPGKRVVCGATTAINQNFPETLDYNRAARDSGALDNCDVAAVHYYGQQFENLVRGGGVADYLNGLNKTIWVTESGAQGVNAQLKYGEETWAFLFEKVPAIERIYIYQLTEASPSGVTYGLLNLDPGATVSDLYVELAGR